MAAPGDPKQLPGYQEAPPRVAAALAEQGEFAVNARRCGCQNWAEIRLGATSVEESPAQCARRCGRTFGCVGFGYENQSCSDPHVCSSQEHTCILWKDKCVTNANSHWDDYVMISGAVEPNQIVIEGLDLERLRGNPELHDGMSASIQQDLAKKLGLPEDTVQVAFDQR
ncbi:unnamed protein product [Prorocentrum cordatum]|uniref:Uncharacterized protein n=1 Tax=Prorocentrum cordatum TaxID=2364126 RepID=A0ABN9TQN5_9DINO|nr:unnamed protein product [Polarella glacialis]